MTTKEFTGELNPVGQPKITEFTGKLDPVEQPKVMEFTGKLDPVKKTKEEEEKPGFFSKAASVIDSAEQLLPFAIPGTEEVRKGIVSGAIGLKSMYRNIGIGTDSALINDAINSNKMFDQIDAGEIKSPEDAKKAGMSFEMAKTYLNLAPEARQNMRAGMDTTIKNREGLIVEAQKALQEYQKDALKYKGKVTDLTDVEGLKDFGNWLAFNAGSAGVQLLPIVAASMTPAGAVGAGLVGLGMSAGEQFGNRVEYLMKQPEMKNLSPEEQATKIQEYVNKTMNVSMSVALANGALDSVTGPAGSILRAKAAKEALEVGAKALTKEEATKKAVKELPRSIGEEGLTGGLQEITSIVGEKALGEQNKDYTDWANVKRVINAAAAEAVGGGVGGAGHVGLTSATTPSGEETTNIAETPEQKVQREAKEAANKQNQIIDITEDLTKKYPGMSSVEAAAQAELTLEALTLKAKDSSLTDEESIEAAQESLKQKAIAAAQPPEQQQPTPPNAAPTSSAPQVVSATGTPIPVIPLNQLNQGDESGEHKGTITGTSQSSVPMSETGTSTTEGIATPTTTGLGNTSTTAGGTTGGEGVLPATQQSTLEATTYIADIESQKVKPNSSKLKKYITALGLPEVPSGKGFNERAMQAIKSVISPTTSAETVTPTSEEAATVTPTEETGAYKAGDIKGVDFGKFAGTTTAEVPVTETTELTSEANKILDAVDQGHSYNSNTMPNQALTTIAADNNIEITPQDTANDVVAKLQEKKNPKGAGRKPLPKTPEQEAAAKVKGNQQSANWKSASAQVTDLVELLKQNTERTPEVEHMSPEVKQEHRGGKI